MYPLENQDLGTPKPHLTSNNNTNKIIIFPEDKNCIKSGTLTKEQETHLLNKIILQMEKNKLKEKKRDSEKSFSISLQPISDDKLLGSDKENNVGDNLDEKDVESVNADNIISFNDLDERHHPSNIQQKNEYVPSQFHSRDIRDLRMSIANNWRGSARGGRRYWDNQTTAHPRLSNRSRNRLNSWQNLSPNFPSQHEFVPDISPLLPDELDQVKIDKSPERTSNSPNVLQQNLNNLDVLSNVIMTPSIKTVPTTGGYQIQNDCSNEDTKSTNSSQVPVALVPQTLNINDLFQILVASGFVKSGIDEKTLPLPSVNKEIKIGEDIMQNPESSSNHSIQVKPVRKSTFSNIKQITFTKPDTLKVRQTALYSSLYAGMQCSSCGMRFSPEASMHYSQHLDWHFRQNRKGKTNIRVATSRKWYYSLSDWKNYEELEDLEEREKNYFDQQAENVGDEVNEDIDIPSVAADHDTTNEYCDVCRDIFDQFFNEEKEEWHLKNAIRMDDRTYHPVCYDFKQSLNEDSVNYSKIEESTEEEKTKDLAIPGLEIIIDDDENDSQKNNSPISTEIVSLESDESKTKAELPKTDNQDDDVILNEIVPIKIIVEDDDDDNQDHGLSINHSVAIKEEKLDDKLEVAGLVSLQKGGQIKIKAEPVDPEGSSYGSSKAAGPDLGTDSIVSVHLKIEGGGDETKSCDDEVTLIEMDEQRTPGLTSDGQPKRQIDEDRSTEFSTVTHPELVTSIDGNVEIIYSTSGTVTCNTVSSNKIKINISKSLPAIPSKEKETTSESDYPTDTYVDLSKPFPPGEEPEPLKLKPSLKGVKLKKLPPIKRGTELTGLCSIM